jgi:hypothetical protein
MAPDFLPNTCRFRKLSPFDSRSEENQNMIAAAHPPDEIAHLALGSGPSRPSSRSPAPVSPKSGSMPSQDSGRLNNSGQTEQARPHSGHPNHQGTVTCTKPDTLRASPQGYVEMAQKEFSTSSRRRGLNRSAINVGSRWMIANIAWDDALILPRHANPTGLNLRERQGCFRP